MWLIHELEAEPIVVIVKVCPPAIYTSVDSTVTVRLSLDTLKRPAGGSGEINGTDASTMQQVGSDEVQESGIVTTSGRACPIV